MTNHVILLRGVNVGGKNRLPMASLMELVTDLGATEVRNYIQSGNVVFAAAPRVAARIAAAVPERIEARFGFAPPVVMRSAAELMGTVAENPFLRGSHPDALHVAFLAERPAKPAAAALDPDRSPGDRFALVGRDLYLHLPKGAAKTKLTNAYLDRTLGTVSTMRNWRTVLALAELAKEA